MWRAKSLIRLRGCACWSESSIVHMLSWRKFCTPVQVRIEKYKWSCSRKCHNNEAEPYRGTERRREQEHTITKQKRHIWNQTKQNCNRWTGLVRSVENYLGPKPVYSRETLTWNKTQWWLKQEYDVHTCVCHVRNQSLTNVLVYIQIYIVIYVRVSLGDHNFGTFLC